MTVCPRCGGSGEIEDPTFYERGPDAQEHPCPACFGHPVTEAEAARIERNIERYRKPRGMR